MSNVMRERPEWRKPDNGIGMDYRSDGFAVRARMLIAAGERLTFDLSGTDLDAFRMYLDGAEAEFDWTRAVVSPSLQALCAVVALAKVHDMCWSFRVSEDAAHFEFGPRVS